jgi:hypothetical protein
LKSGCSPYEGTSPQATAIGSIDAGMRLRTIQIADRGVPGKERLHIAVDAAANLNFYAVFDTVRIGDGLISQFPRHTYWFQPQAVEAGDTVILYTGPGENSFARRHGGGTVYCFYWGFDTTLWNEPSSCAVLLEVSQWQTSPPTEMPPREIPIDPGN